MLHSLSSNLHHAKNEEFPALMKSQPIHFGAPTAQTVRHSSPRDIDTTHQNSSRKRRVKKRKQVLSSENCHGDCCNRTSISTMTVVEMRNPDATDVVGLNKRSQKPPCSLLKEALFTEQSSLTTIESLTTFRATEDEGFVDGTTDLLSIPASKQPVVLVGPRDCDNSLVVHKQHTSSHLDALVSIGQPDRGSSSSSASSSSSSSPVSCTSPSPAAQSPRATTDVDDKDCCSADVLNDRSMCTQCKENFEDVQVFGSLELPHLWDPILSHTKCCRLSGGDDAKTITDERHCSATTASSSVNRMKTETLSGTGDNPTYELDDLDEDEMEGTDLLHLISNSLDRFNAIVHPSDVSCLTSGLGVSEALLSELDWSFTESSTSLGQLKPTDKEGSVEKFAEIQLPWFNSRRTSSSCPDQSSLVARVRGGVATTVPDPDGLASSPLPPLAFPTSFGSSNRQPDRESPCAEETTSCANTSYGADQSLGVTYPHPTGSCHTQSLATSIPFDSESVYQGSVSHQHNSPLHVSSSLTNHRDGRQLDPGRLICASQTGVSVQTTANCPFTSSTTGATIPWITANGVGNNSRIVLSSATPPQTPAGDPTATGFFVPDVDLSTLCCSDSGSNPDWDSLPRALDWLSIQAGNRRSAPISDHPTLVPNPITDIDNLVLNRAPGHTQQPSAAPLPSPGLTTCSRASLGFDAIPAVNVLPGMDFQMLFSRSPFTATTTTTVQRSQPSTTATATLGANCGQSLLSPSFLSGAATANSTGFDWDAKSLNGFTVPYTSLDRLTGPPTTATLSHTPGRSRLPHSDSVSVVGAELEVGGRRAGVSISRFDSSDHLVAQPSFSAANPGMHPPGLEPLVRSGANAATTSSSRIVDSSGCTAAFLMQQSVASHSARAGSTRLPSIAAMTTGHGQPRQGNWSAGWQTRSPTSRTMGGENYRHAAPFRRFNNGSAHIPLAMTEHCTGMHLASNGNRHSAVGMRGGSPTNKLSTNMKVNGQLVPSYSSSSSSSSLSGASFSGHNSTASSNAAATNCPDSNESGKPVVAKWRRACSFYLRGHCKKEDCEFAHDLTKVTCKFWEMGECFKGPTCPFLHGYPPEITEA